MTTRYRFRAAQADGSLLHGWLQMTSREDALAHLRTQGLFPLHVEPETDLFARRRAIPADDLAVGLRTLGTLLRADLPLNRALATFEVVAPPTWAAALPGVREAVREGQGVAKAMDNSSVSLPPLLLGMLQAAESGGGSGLADAVARAADVAEENAKLRSAIRSALAYPILLAFVGAISVAIVVAIVLPRFADLLGDMGAATPPLTRATLLIADGARLSIPFVVLIGVSLTLAWRMWWPRPEFRGRVHAWLLSLPIVGDLRLAAASSRLCSALAALARSGVPIAPALQFSARSVGDHAIADRIARARERLIAGARLSDALAVEACITAVARRMARAGEESGQLVPMLERAATLDAERVAARIKALVRLLEPMLIVAIAGIIALVAGALLQAVYAVRPA